MNVSGLIEKIKVGAIDLAFNEVISIIDSHYRYVPTRFTNGVGDNAVVSEAGVNQGSCKVFAFAKLNGLNEQETLACFCEHYRDVLATPAGDNHANIRRFMTDGWAGIAFDSMPLSVKN